MSGKRKVVLVRARPGAYSGVLAARFPLALLRVASYLHEDYECVLIDQAKDRDWAKQLRRELTTGRPVVMGVGTMTGPQLKGAIEASVLTREVAPDVKIAWGGVHPSLFPKDVALDPRVDFAVIGEGELTFNELVRTLDDGGDLHKVPGLAFEEGGAAVVTEKRPFMNLNDLPPLPFQLVHVPDYLYTDFGVEGILDFETARGCPFDCSFCYNKSYNELRWRAFTPERVIDELTYLKERFGAKAFCFQDDEFFVNLKRVRGIMDAVEAAKLDTRFVFQGARIDMFMRMDDDLLDQVDRCGTASIQFGLESGSVRVLNMIGKNYTRDDALEHNRRLARCKNIKPYYNFIIGFPIETREDVMDSVDIGWQIVQDNPKARLALYHIYKPYPGTELFDEAVKAGFKPPKTADEWANHDWQYRSLPWMSDEDLDFSMRITVASLFVDEKVEERIFSPAFRAFTRIYKKIARWRFKTKNFRFMPERHLFHIFFKTE